MHSLQRKNHTVRGALAALGVSIWAPGVGAAEVINSTRVLEVFAGLAVVLALVFVLAVVLKRMHMLKPAGEGRLRILESLSLGTREKLVLVEVDGETVLLGLSQAGINALHAPNLDSSLQAQTRLGEAASDYDSIQQAQLAQMRRS